MAETAPTLIVEPNEEIIFKHVYYISKNESDHPYNPIAIAPILKTNGSIEWRDTSRGAFALPKYMLVDGVDYTNRNNNDPREILIILHDDMKIQFTYVTIEIYNKALKDKCEGHPNFRNTEELQQFYLTNF